MSNDDPTRAILAASPAVTGEEGWVAEQMAKPANVEQYARLDAFFAAVLDKMPGHEGVIYDDEVWMSLALDWIDSLASPAVTGEALRCIHNCEPENCWHVPDAPPSAVTEGEREAVPIRRGCGNTLKHQGHRWHCPAWCSGDMRPVPLSTVSVGDLLEGSDEEVELLPPPDRRSSLRGGPVHPRPASPAVTAAEDETPLGRQCPVCEGAGPVSAAIYALHLAGHPAPAPAVTAVPADPNSED